ncbi:hypothetical protein C1H46_002742 [Malus baccata]|uniref:Uncharacterized protein n=1 Tax=Malus baccata TaxID=106549 RepID=A0A540NL08_MALBA|nr:hypothetical protein C1H46_002742 [Malus baccata]
MNKGMIECSVCHSKIVAPNSKTFSRAYDRHKSRVSSKQRVLNVLLVVGDCMLVGLQPILVYMSKVDGKFEFSPISVNFLTEAAKVLFAVVMLLLQARNQKVGEKPLLSISTFTQAARNNVLLAVPAFLYAINNYLKFTMQLYFNPATVKMLSNLKVLVIAVLLKMIMKRRFSIIQWEALALLLIGISVNQLRSLPEGTIALGLPVSTGAYIYTLIFVTVPSLASVYNEYALKSQYDTSIYLQDVEEWFSKGSTWLFASVLVISVTTYPIWPNLASTWILITRVVILFLVELSVCLVHEVEMLPEFLWIFGCIRKIRQFAAIFLYSTDVEAYYIPTTYPRDVGNKNLFLYGYGAIFNFLGILVMAIIKGPGSFDILHGHSRATMFLIANNAAQGILSSFFFKYADTILKKYSSTVATIFTGIASALLFGHKLTMNFVLGISIVFISMHQFFSPISKLKEEEQNGKLEMIDVDDKHRSKDSFINMAAGANEEASHRPGPDERQPLLPI